MSAHDANTSSARILANAVTQHIVRQALAKGSMLLGVKAGGLVLIVVSVLVLLVLIIAAVTGAVIQTSTLVWPVPLAADGSDYVAGGWRISSRFGWREQPDGRMEFHDGLDVIAPVDRACPFGYHCGIAAMVDGQVQYVGWDQAGARNPERAGGGQLVTVANGQDDHEILFAHLEPYRLYVQLQGRIDDAYGRYDAARDYAPIGDGARMPDLDDGTIALTCAGDMPTFVPTRTGPGTVTFLYDRPADCSTTVTWGQRGDGWAGWVPDVPHDSTLTWKTPIILGQRAEDVALRFRAHLVPPPPPPTVTPTATMVLPTTHPQHGAVALPTPRVGTNRAGEVPGCASVADGRRRCVWALAAIPAHDAPHDAPLIWGETYASAAERAPGQRFQYSIVVSSSASTSTQVRVTDVLDAHLDLHDIQASGGTCQVVQQQITCHLTTQADAAAVVTIVVHVHPTTPSGTVLENAALLTLPDGTTRPTRPAIVLIQGMPVTPVSPTAQATMTPWPTPTDPPSFTPTPTDPLPTATPSPGCALHPLVPLAGVRAPQPRLVDAAAASFAEVRAAIHLRTGIDVLAVLADVLRAPEYRSTKPGVLDTSWHKAGRAIDLDQGGPFVRVAEGRMVRLYVNGVDITAIFAAAGWQRIPAQGETAEWWHYEYHPEGIAWTSAMRHVWSIARLRAAFPQIGWDQIGCGDGGDAPPISPPVRGDTECVLGQPTYTTVVETLNGCGPPVRVGTPVYQLDSLLGFVGLSGQTTGPHLHLGLAVRSYDGTWALRNICTPEWLQGQMPPPDAACWTRMADPLDFLPRAPGNDPHLPQRQRNESGSLPLVPEGAPYQLPPPNAPDSLVFPPEPHATPVGQYWSPYAAGGRYGGSTVAAWFCTLWNGWPWCHT